MEAYHGDCRFNLGCTMKTILLFLAIAIIGTSVGVSAGWMFALYGSSFGWGLLVAILVTILVIDGVFHENT